MVFVLQIQGLIISKYIGNELEDEAIQESDTSSGPVDAKKVAIISAAVKQHIKESK
tara:strand:+ start:5120 stop:5287 length:168 start_codon:yes stop_codon:yes gene_type:complete